MDLTARLGEDKADPRMKRRARTLRRKESEENIMNFEVFLLGEEHDSATARFRGRN